MNDYYNYELEEDKPVVNKLVQTYCGITGRSEYGDLDVRVGPCSDYYYKNCETKEQKLAHIEAYAENALNIYLHDAEILRVYNAIEEGSRRDLLTYEDRIFGF